MFLFNKTGFGQNALSTFRGEFDKFFHYMDFKNMFGVSVQVQRISVNKRI